MLGLAWCLHFYHPCFRIVWGGTSGPFFPHKTSLGHSFSGQVFVTVLISSGCHQLLPSVTQQTVQFKSLSQITLLSNHFPPQTAIKIIFPNLLSEAHSPPQSHSGSLSLRLLPMAFNANNIPTAPHWFGLDYFFLLHLSSEPSTHPTKWAKPLAIPRSAPPDPSSRRTLTPFA